LLRRPIPIRVLTVCVISVLLCFPAVSAMALSPPVTETLYLEYAGGSTVCPFGDAQLVTSIPSPSSFGLDYCGYYSGPSIVVTSAAVVLYFSASSVGGTGYLQLGPAVTEVAHLTLGGFTASGCTPSAYYFFSGPLTVDVPGQVLSTGEQVDLELAGIVHVPGYAFPCTGSAVGGQDTPSALMITGVPIGSSVPQFPLGLSILFVALVPAMLGLRKWTLKSRMLTP